MTEHKDKITVAGEWLATNWTACPRPITRTLRDRFGLDFGEAVKALALANRIREGRT